MDANGHLRSSHLTPCRDPFCDEIVKQDRETGFWFITMEHPGFNSRKNNSEGYETALKALAASVRSNPTTAWISRDALALHATKISAKTVTLYLGTQDNPDDREKVLVSREHAARTETPAFRLQGRVVLVVDIISGKIIRLKSADCGLGCHCAAVRAWEEAERAAAERAFEEYVDAAERALESDVE